MNSQLDDFLNIETMWGFLYIAPDIPFLVNWSTALTLIWLGLGIKLNQTEKIWCWKLEDRSARENANQLILST
jgi:hypothetical protein